MTYQGDPARSGNSVLKALVVIAVVAVAYWSSNGGFQSIDIPGTVPSVTTTLGGSSTTTDTLQTTTTTLAPTTTIGPTTTPAG